MSKCTVRPACEATHSVGNAVMVTSGRNHTAGGQIRLISIHFMLRLFSVSKEIVISQQA